MRACCCVGTPEGLARAFAPELNESDRLPPAREFETVVALMLVNAAEIPGNAPKTGIVPLVEFPTKNAT